MTGDAEQAWVEAKGIAVAGRFEGRSVFVAGASGGTDLGIAREGARLAVLSRSADRVEAADELRGLGDAATGDAR